jgi:NitT/TauT family transport system permease protein
MASAVGTAARRLSRRRGTRRGSRSTRGLGPWYVLMSRTLTAAVIVAVWEVAAKLNEHFVAAPIPVVNEFWAWVENGTLWSNLRVTLTEIGIGFGLAFVLGVFLGWLLAESRWLDVATRPFIDVINAIPRFGLAPLFVLWFGFGVESKVVLVVSVVVFVVLINVQTGIESVDQDYVMLARSLGATKWDVARVVTMPSLAPWLVASLRLGGAYAIASAVVGEFIGASAGIGYLLSYESNVLNTTGEFVALMVLGIVAAVFTAATMLIERRVLAWQAAGRDDVETVRVGGAAA